MEPSQSLALCLHGISSHLETYMNHVVSEICVELKSNGVKNVEFMETNWKNKYVSGKFFHATQHTHAPDEVDENCDTCKNHGHPLAQEVPEYVVSKIPNITAEPEKPKAKRSRKKQAQTFIPEQPKYPQQDEMTVQERIDQMNREQDALEAAAAASSSGADTFDLPQEEPPKPAPKRPKVVRKPAAPKKPKKKEEPAPAPTPAPAPAAPMHNPDEAEEETPHPGIYKNILEKMREDDDMKPMENLSEDDFSDQDEGDGYDWQN